MRPPVWLFGAVIPAAAMAQEASVDPVPQAAAPPLVVPGQPAGQPSEQVGQADPDSCKPAKSDAQQEGKKKGPGLVEDAGTAASSQGGALAGAAVAGPIGAAVGSVVVDHVGRSVKHLVFGKKRHDRKLADQECEAETVAVDGNG
jgi:hypothetical protein